MAGLNSKMWVDTDFINQLKHLPDDVKKTAHRAVQLTNHWFRAITMAELGYALEIDEKSAFRSRFKVYSKAGVKARLWVGIRQIGVHRLGKPQQTPDGVKVGSHFFEKAFISPMNSDELLVFRRAGKHRKTAQMVMMDISAEAEEILGTYQTELNAKFQEFFIREFRQLHRP